MASKKKDSPPRFLQLFEASDLLTGRLASVLSVVRNKEEAENQLAEFEMKSQEASSNTEDLSTASSPQESKNPNINPVKSGVLQCSYCCAVFANSDEQRLHYKLDWHRYNLKQSSEGKPPVNEQEFDRIVDKMGETDNLSISGSGEDDSDNEDDISLTRNPKLYFLTKEGTCLGVYKTILVDPKIRDLPDDESLIQLLKCTGVKRSRWAVFMVGGGHFAGAIFDGAQVMVHKTFHCYTVRAKQGGSQGSADSRSGTSHPKSAGASLRRYNEMSLIQHVQDITKLWSKELAGCQLIFYRAGANSRKVLFGGKAPALNSSDIRLRSVPFPTRRATFAEVKRVHSLLSRIDLVASLDSLNPNGRPGELRSKQSPAKQGKGRVIHRSKSREIPVRELPEIVRNLASMADSSGEEGNGWNFHTEVVNTVDLLSEFQSSVRPKRKKRKNNKKASMQAQLQDLELESSEDEDEGPGADPQSNSDQIELQNKLLTAARGGNCKLLAECISDLASIDEQPHSEKESNRMTPSELVNTQFGEGRSSCLHLAAMQGHRNMVHELMQLGADPCAKDKQKRVPYALAKDKETRNTFRKFQAQFPDRYDWKVAQVPPPVSEEQQLEKEKKLKEKKAAKRQEKKEKEKAAKEEEKKVREKEQERERFLALSDREKRALAAERRLLANSGSVSLIRCFMCGLDITGKVPFSYCDNKFCSPACVKKHRSANH